jgi:hypothetical protein
MNLWHEEDIKKRRGKKLKVVEVIRLAYQLFVT